MSLTVCPLTDEVLGNTRISTTSEYLFSLYHHNGTAIRIQNPVAAHNTLTSLVLDREIYTHGHVIGNPHSSISRGS